MAMLRRAFVRKAIVSAGAVMAIGLMSSSALAQAALPKVRVGVMASGTVKWELLTMAARGLDKANGFELVIGDYATGDAADIAINGNQIEVIAKDFIVVSAQRAQGLDYTWVPHSATVGGVIVRKDSGINGVADLAGKTIVVSPNALDKSYILLRAWTQSKLGKDVTAVAKEVKFAASPLANETLTKGDAQAAMNLWNWNARLLANPDYKQLIGTEDILKDLGVDRKLPMIGWVFHEAWAKAPANVAALNGFLTASQATKQILLKDDAAWNGLKEAMGVGADNNLFLALRDQYRRGIVTTYSEDDRKAAAAAFAILAKLGGEDLVGKSPTISPGTFWAGFTF
ncbi:MAG: transporter substrate-binding domain-containing protein [Alphaproteobacteria bacterium]|nr:transporter substrate-binding domain-containing protein [Alphaproteobacteria bacterium]